MKTTCLKFGLGIAVLWIAGCEGMDQGAFTAAEGSTESLPMTLIESTVPEGLQGTLPDPASSLVEAIEPANEDIDLEEGFSPVEQMLADRRELDPTVDADLLEEFQDLASQGGQEPGPDVEATPYITHYVTGKNVGINAGMYTAGCGYVNYYAYGFFNTPGLSAALPAGRSITSHTHSSSTTVSTQCCMTAGAKCGGESWVCTIGGKKYPCYCTGKTTRTLTFPFKNTTSNVYLCQ